MVKKLLITLIWAFLPTGFIYAQNGLEDSARVEAASSGKGEGGLNARVLEGVGYGDLISPFSSVSKASRFIMPARMDMGMAGFSGGLVPELDPDIMDPYLYFKYYFTFTKLPPLEELKSIPGFDLSGISLKTGALSPRDPRAGVSIVVDNSIIKGGVFGGFRMTGDFNAALSSIFSPSFRRRIYNRKHANAWKIYNGSERGGGVPPATINK
jgi:hypothetical protein